MRSNVLVIAGLAVLSTSAFASKARMEALGQGDASYYLMDSRTVFVNPSALNEMKNYVVTEWGASQQTDSVTSPRAEGGFFREMGAFSYGLYLGNNGDARTASGTFQSHQNALDLVLAGDMGLKWGARLHYANSKDETGGFEKKNSALGLGLGVMHGDASGYLNLALSDKSNGATVAGDEWKRKPGINLGGAYKWSGMNFFADYTSTSEEITAGTTGVTTWTVNTIGTAGATTLGTGTNGHKTSALTVGASKMHEVNPGARIVSDVRFISATDEISGSSVSTSNGKATVTKLPVTFALETDATSWLTLRGSVSQNFVLGETKTIDGKKSSISNSATANAGATLNFGKLKVDGVIGTSAAARNGALGTSNSGVLTTDNLMSRVGVTYNF
jgi:hypothetical protein